jgi:hypothetical protein
MIQKLKNLLILRYQRLKFAFKNDWLLIVLSLLFVLWIIMDWLSNWQLLNEFKTHWNNELDQIVSLTTLDLY